MPALKLTGEEIDRLVQKREVAGRNLTNFPDDEEIQQVLDRRFIAEAKAEKRAGGKVTGFDIDTIKPGMSPETRQKAMAAIREFF